MTSAFILMTVLHTKITSLHEYKIFLTGNYSLESYMPIYDNFLFTKNYTEYLLLNSLKK